MTILLSNVHSPNADNVQEKLIKIKPIAYLKKDISHLNNREMFDDQHTVERELQIASETLQNLKAQQSHLINETKAKIKQEKANWETEKQYLIEQAKEEGYQAGFDHGKEKSMNEYAHLLEKANAITTAAKKDYYATLEQSDGMILDIAIHTAEKIVKQSLSENPESFLPIITEAIREIKDQPCITIYLHAVNYKFILQQKDELAHILNDEKEISIYIDKDAKEGHCLIEHQFGQVDASIDTQLQQVRNVLHVLATENKR